MKAAAMTVWIFINLLCFGMCGYLYLIWSQYWMYIERQRLFNKSPDSPQKTSAGVNNQEGYTEKYSSKTPLNFSTARLQFTGKSRRSAIGVLRGSSVLTQTSKPAVPSRQSTNIVRKAHGRPRFPNIQETILEFDSDKYICDDYLSSGCKAQTAEFKALLTTQFHRVLLSSETEMFRPGRDSRNIYDVQYYITAKRRSHSRQELLCELKKIGIQTVTSDDEPFAKLDFRIPRAPLQEGRVFNTCAIVTNAGALLGSRLGQFIDSHDVVIRFNNAPTVNYTDDVGSKTTIRILNSQKILYGNKTMKICLGKKTLVVTKPEFNFLDDPMYTGISILIWDPAKFSTTLKYWYYHPDFPLFPVYKKLLDLRPNADVHLLNPQVLWDLWTLLQDTSIVNLRRNPPSSGFIGLWFALQRCNRVRAFEFVPSVRATRRCHYYSVHEDPGCTLGSWHPLAQEKVFADQLRDNSDFDTFQLGFIDIPGLRNVGC